MCQMEKLRQAARSLQKVARDMLERYPPARQLGLFTLIALSLLAVIEALTIGPIERHLEATQRARLTEVLSSVPFDNDPFVDRVMIEDTQLGTLGAASPFFLARRQGQVVAVVFKIMAPGGYNGAIELLMAVEAHGALTGVRVLKHRETPGLGDLIETRKSKWIMSFNGKSLLNPVSADWRIRRDGGAFDQFTGATITPRAIVQAVYNGLTIVHDHHGYLFGSVAEAVPRALQ